MRGVPAKPVAEGTPPSRMRRFAEAQRRHCDACDDGAVRGRARAFRVRVFRGQRAWVFTELSARCAHNPLGPKHTWPETTVTGQDWTDSMRGLRFGYGESHHAAQSRLCVSATRSAALLGVPSATGFAGTPRIHHHLLPTISTGFPRASSSSSTDSKKKRRSNPSCSSAFFPLQVPPLAETRSRSCATPRAEVSAPAPLDSARSSPRSRWTSNLPSRIAGARATARRR
jgi:hypothetical protein